MPVLIKPQNFMPTNISEFAVHVNIWLQDNIYHILNYVY
jgi:hypothetical protein